MEETTLNHSSGEQLFIQTLQDDYLRRRTKNSAYSLRSYAISLKLDQSLLTKIMSSKRRVSKNTIETIGPKIGLTPSQVLSCLHSKIINKQSNFTPLIDDEFEIISKWYYFAILELMKTKHFTPSIEFIATRLDLPRCIVKDALARLEKLHFISMALDGWNLLKRSNTWTNTQSTTNAKIAYQSELINQSQKALHDIDFQLREHASLTVAIDTARLPEFKEKLKQIRMELDNFFQPKNQSQNYDEVYQLTIALFPSTKIKDKKS